MPPPSEDAGIQKRCLGCSYPLDHLPGNRCPECGREFLPGDAATYFLVAVDAPRRRMMKWSVAALAVAIGIDLFLFLGVMRFLGGWGTSLMVPFHGVLILLGFIGGMDDDPAIQRLALVGLLVGIWPIVVGLVLFLR